MLQYLFSLPRKDIFISQKALSNLYRGLSIIIEYAESLDIEYIKGNLNFLASSQKEDIITRLNEKSNSIKSGTNNYFILDLIFRSYLAGIEGLTSNVELSVVVKLFNLLQPTILTAKKAEVFQKFLEHYEK